MRILIAALTVTGSAALAADPSAGTATNPPTPHGAKNVVVFGEPTSFAGWPANNGAWTWDGGKEILVGFTKGPFVGASKRGHVASLDRHLESIGKT